MPYVSVRITRDGVTPAHKGAPISGITDLLADVLGKDPDTTFVVTDEVAVQDWGVAGRDRRRVPPPVTTDPAGR